MTGPDPDGRDPGSALPTTAVRLGRFSLRVLRRFQASRGLLLAGGVGYNLLLSIVPLFIVLGVGLSRLLPEQQLLATIDAQLRLLAPGQAEALLGIVRPILRSPDAIGLLGFGVLLFFSSLAFRMLEDAIALLFGDRRRGRSAWFSTLVPYGFVLVLGAGLVVITLLVSLANTLAGQELAAERAGDPLSPTARALAYVLGFLGLGFLFTALYKLLPERHIAPGRALVGGFVAAALWQGALQGLVWYFAEVSLVDTVYGAFATVVVFLLVLEAGAAILLLGAQVIAELERSAGAGVPWHEAPPEADPTERR
jgi:YihY family inner membrane protein